jgi:copper chaperone
MNTSSPTAMSPEQFQVQGMTCQHCVRAVTQAIQACDAQAQVEIDLAAGRVLVRSALGRTQIAEAIREEGYSVAA